MSPEPYALMVELLSRIRHDTLDGIRNEIAAPHTENPKRLDPWSSLKEVLSNESPDNEEESVAQEKPSIVLLKTAGLRLVDNLSAAARQRDMTAFHLSIDKRLDDTRIACMLFTMNLGNNGMPWEGVGVADSTVSPGRLAVRLGSISPNADDLKKSVPDLDWNLPVPALLPLDQGCALFVVGPDAMRKSAIDSLHSVALRLLLAKPLGGIRLSVLDPLGYSVGRPPWSLWPEAVLTDSQSIEDTISQTFSQMEQIATEKLRDHENLQAFNEWAAAHGEAAIPHHILILHDCPNAFSPRILQKLHGLARNGGRCGIVILIHWCEKKDGLSHSKLDSMALDGVIVEPESDGRFKWRGDAFSDCWVALDALPPQATMERIVLDVAREFKERASQTVNFEEIQPICVQKRGRRSSANGIDVPLGIGDDGKLVSLEIGEGKGSHGLIIGGTGSGKSSLMHVIITGLAEAYPPEELQLYLIDLKGGVEFRRYAANHLPHARVIAIDHEREFALSSLESLCLEMRRRMDLYRASSSGITSIPMYRNSGEKLPRILLVMDEFQNLFSENDDLADKSRSRLGKLLKEGRGFGIHVLLCTQSLKGILLRGGSLEQIELRLVLRCSTDDSREALASDNLAGNALPRYQCIYNDQQGNRNANVQFKAAYLSPDENATRLAALSERYTEEKWKTVIFEGDGKAYIDTCPAFVQVAASTEGLTRGTAPRIWLGEPIAIQPPVEARLDSIRGKNLLALMQCGEAGPAILYNSLLALLGQSRPGGSSFSIINLLGAEHETQAWPEKIAAKFQHTIRVSDATGASTMFLGLLDDLNSRIQTPGNDDPCYIFVFGLQYCRELRPKESYGEPALDTPAGALKFLLREGPENGMHLVVWCDMLSNLARCGRGLLDEFGLRVAGKLEQSDSNAIFGSPAASRLRGENRALFADDTLPGTTRIFRPFETPPFSLFETLSKQQKAL